MADTTKWPDRCDRRGEVARDLVTGGNGYFREGAVNLLAWLRKICFVYPGRGVKVI